MSLQPVLSTPGELHHEILPRKSQSWWHDDDRFRGLCGLMRTLTMEVCHCGRRNIGHGAPYLLQLSNILLVELILGWYGATHIRSHATAYCCWVQFYVLFINVRPGPWFRWLQLLRRGGLTGVSIVVVSAPGAHSMKRHSLGSNWNQSHRTEMFGEPWLAVVEKVWKMITKSGMSWGIYCMLPVTMEWMTVNLHVLLKFYPAAYSPKLQVSPMVPQFAVSWSDVVCSFVCLDRLKWVTTDISCLIDIKMKFFDGKDVWWCLCQHIATILHEPNASYQVMRYS